MSFKGACRRKFTELVPDHIFGYENRNMTFPLWTPKVKPTISGEIVERRDQVLIAGGFLPVS
jgi:hypothetical protein